MAMEGRFHQRWDLYAAQWVEDKELKTIRPCRTSSAESWSRAA